MPSRMHLNCFLVIALLMAACAVDAQQTTVTMSIFDSDGIEEIGTWTTSSYDGSVPYRHDGNTAKGNKEARFTPDVPEAGWYDVQWTWVPFLNRATNARLRIEHARGTTWRRFDQRLGNAGEWHSAGIYWFDAGQSGRIVIDNAESDGYVLAQNVRLAPGPVTLGWYQRQSTWLETVRVCRENLMSEADNQRSWDLFWDLLFADFPELEIEAFQQTVASETVFPSLDGARFFYVSPDGNDSAPGTETRPLASLQGARDAVRALKVAQGGALLQPVRVQFASGIYRINRPVVFEPEDSGTAACPILYEAPWPERVEFRASQKVQTPWETDDGRVYYTDLAAGSSITLHCLDSTGVEIEGDWLQSAFQSNVSYLHDKNAGKGEKHIRFTPSLPEAGYYQVTVDGSAYVNRSISTPVDILHAGQTETVRIDQRQVSDYEPLGVYYFDANGEESVTFRNEGTNGYVLAKHVRFLPVVGVWSSNIQFRQLFVNEKRQTLARFPNAPDTNVRSSENWLTIDPLVSNSLLAGLTTTGDYVEHEFEVSEAGTFDLWIGLAAIYDPMNPYISLELDGANVALPTLTGGPDFREVQWTRIGSFSLSVGTHMLRLSHTWYSYPIHLDAYVLSPDPSFTPSGQNLPPIEAGSGRIDIQAEDETLQTSRSSSVGFQMIAIGDPAPTDYIQCRSSDFQAEWTNADQADLYVMPSYAWYNANLPSTHVDPVNHRFYVEGSETLARLEAGNRYFVANVLSELDNPGEWFLDYETLRLYYYPLGGSMRGLQVEVSTADRIIEIRGDLLDNSQVQYLSFSGFVFRHADHTLNHWALRSSPDCAVLLQNASHCLVEHCVFLDNGGNAVRIDQDSALNRVVNNMVERGGSGGFLLVSSMVGRQDDLPYLPSRAYRSYPMGNLIASNYVNDCGWYKKYNAGIHFEGRDEMLAHAPGNVYANNHIENLARNGIFGFQNQGGYVIAHNRIEDCLNESDDGGAVHIATVRFGDTRLAWIHHNAIHRLHPYRYRDPDLANGHCLYMDNHTSHVRLENNILSGSVKGLIFYHGGSHLDVRNNLILQDPQRLIWLSQVYEGQYFRRNVVMGEPVKTPYYFLVKDMQKSPTQLRARSIDYNCIYTPGYGPYVMHDGSLDWSGGLGSEGTLTFAQWQAMGFDVNSTVADPQLIDLNDPETGLAAGSPAVALGFEQIETDAIGLWPSWQGLRPWPARVQAHWQAFE